MHLSQRMWKKLPSLSAQLPSPPSAQTYCRSVIYHCSLRNAYAVADLHSKILNVCPLSPSVFLHFHEDFGNSWPNNRLAPLFRVGDPYGKSWICCWYGRVLWLGKQEFKILLGIERFARWLVWGASGSEGTSRYVLMSHYPWVQKVQANFITAIRVWLSPPPVNALTVQTTVKD